MKLRFAIVNGQRAEPTLGAKGLCAHCDSELIAKCGGIRIHHWAHKEKDRCDSWWKPKTDWHRAWQAEFPSEWQEISHKNEATGEKHIADVKTDQGWAIEFQHSHLKPDERRARDTFYNPKLVWVVNGMRRIRDKAQFFKTLEAGTRVHINLQMLRLGLNECALLRDWANCRAPVFFDFADANGKLWCLLPGNPNEPAYVAPFPRARLIEYLRTRAVQKEQSFEGLLETLRQIVLRDLQPRRPPDHFGQSLTLQQLIARRQRARRFRF